jgi:hypothetical protein
MYSARGVLNLVHSLRNLGKIGRRPECLRLIFPARIADRLAKLTTAGFQLLSGIERDR